MSTYPVITANLAGVIDDPDSEEVIATWEVVSGPGPVEFEDSSSAETVAFFVTPGEYVLRLKADDLFVELADEVKITRGLRDMDTAPQRIGRGGAAGESGRGCVEQS